jgi:hypothetical protein
MARGERHLLYPPGKAAVELGLADSFWLMVYLVRLLVIKVRFQGEDKGEIGHRLKAPGFILMSSG